MLCSELDKLEIISLNIHLRNLVGVHFLCPHKKRTKEGGWGMR